MVEDGDARGGSGRLSGSDPGSARERTELAWTRSGLAVAVTVAVILRRLWPLSHDRAVAALAVVAVAAICWVVAAHLARLKLGAVAGGGLGTSTFRLLTIGTLALAAIGVVISFL
jgi:hypothetical protein